MTHEELFLRNSNRRGYLFFSDHASDKQMQLMIETDDVIECIENGPIIEKQLGYADEDPRMLVYSNHEKMFYIVVAIDFPHACIIISIIGVDFTMWDKDGNSIIRK